MVFSMNYGGMTTENWDLHMLPYFGTCSLYQAANKSEYLYVRYIDSFRSQMQVRAFNFIAISLCM